MKILVTAFGPFGGRPENASTLALRGLGKSFPNLRTRILPVDAVIAPARLRDALRRLRPDALVMLGEAAGSKTIRLETTAWNELDFRIPDIAGRRFTPQPIRADGPEKLLATLPLEQIHRALHIRGHEVIFSDDPGRYLCNQISYVALDQIHHVGPPIPAGFIHLPLAAHYPTDRAADALGALLRTISTPPA